MSPQIGCNYSLPLLQLLQNGQADVDWIKLSHLPTLAHDLPVARGLRPVLLHTLGSAGRRPFVYEQWDWEQIGRWLGMAGSPHVALHLDTRREDWNEPIDLVHPSPQVAQAALERCIANVRLVRDKLPLPLLIENLPYLAEQGPLHSLLRPEAVARVCMAAGVGLLVDAAHIRVAADCLGLAPYDYAAALPLELTQEIHISGPRWLDGELRDCHCELADEDWALLEWLLARTNPRVVTLEYAGTGPDFEMPGRSDPEALARQLHRLSHLLAGRKRAGCVLIARPQVGCNYSLPLTQLLRSGQVDVDWIKLASPETLADDLPAARRVRPVLLHTLGRIGRRPADLARYGWNQLAEALRSAGSPHLAAHLYTTAGDWDEMANGAPLRPEFIPAVMQRFVANLRTAQPRLAVPLLIENMPNNHPGMLPPLAGPELVRQACDEAGVGLLLDAAHLRVSALALGMDPRAYAAGLPLDRVREIHVSGPRWVDGELCDRHCELGEEDWQLVEWLLARTQPQVVTLEYGGTGTEQELAGRNDPAELLRQLRRLRSLLSL